MSREPRGGGTVRDQRMVRLGYAVALIAAIVVTIINGYVGWASNEYDWHPPVFIFTNGIMVTAWVGIFAMTHLERGRRQRAEEVAAVAAEMATIRRSQEATRKAVQQLRELVVTRLEELTRAQMADRYLKAIDGAERRPNIVPLGDRRR